MKIARGRIRLYPGQLLNGLFSLSAGNRERGRFEESFQDYVGCSKAYALSSGTHALYISLKSLGLEPGDEVMVAAYNAPLILGVLDLLNLKPVFVDVLADSHTIDPELINKRLTKKIKAIIITHIEGFACRMNDILDIAKKHKIWLIEDCAHAVGTEYDGKRVGSFGDISIFSLGPMKHLNALGGGIIAVNNERLIPIIDSMSIHFQKPSTFYCLKKLFSGLSYYLLLNTIFFNLITFSILRLSALFNKDPILDSYENVGNTRKPVIYHLSGMQAKMAYQNLALIDRRNEIKRKKFDFLERNIDLRCQQAESGSVQAFLNFTFLADDPWKLKKKLLAKGIDIQHSWMHDISHGSPVAGELDKHTMYITLNLKQTELKGIVRAFR